MSVANVNRESLERMRKELIAFGSDADTIAHRMRERLAKAVTQAEDDLNRQIKLVEGLESELSSLKKENNKLHAERDHAKSQLERALRQQVELNRMLQESSEECSRLYSALQRAIMEENEDQANALERALHREQERHNRILAELHQNEAERMRLGKLVRGLEHSIQEKEREIGVVSQKLEYEEKRLAEMRVCFRRIKERGAEFSHQLASFLEYAFESNDDNISTLDMCIELVDEYDRIHFWS